MHLPNERSDLLDGNSAIRHYAYAFIALLGLIHRIKQAGYSVMVQAQPSDEDLTPLQLMDKLCDEFESSCAANESPQIPTFLNRIEKQYQDRLFEQLMLLQLDLDTEKPALDEWLENYPDYTQSVFTVFRQLDLTEVRDPTIGPYKVIKEIARGGMGVVYLATDPRLDRRIAVKLLNKSRSQDQEWLVRFRREARLAGALNHPNILTIHDIGDSLGVPYIATELVEGKTLRDELADHRFTIQESINYAIQLANGMMAAHSMGVIHRDLKPDNIMIRSDGILKILDFGLAKSLRTGSLPNGSDLEGSDFSKTGVISGTVNYMSPEQARGVRLNASSDVFSFGIILFYMLTGVHPFSGKTPSDIMAAILVRAPKPFTDFKIELPNALQKLASQCLNKSSDDRPSAAQIHTELKQLQSATEFPKQKPEAAGLHSPAPSTQQMSVAPIVLPKPGNVRYALSGDVNIAWQEIGSGPIDLVFVMGWVSHLDWFWKHDSFASFLRRLATFSRVILFDKRGTGLSDKVPLNQLPTLEQRMDDVRAVMEMAGSKRAVLCGVSEGGPLCTLFAATYPQKTIALTMIGSYARRLWAEDYPWGPSTEHRELFLQEIAKKWGGPLGIEDRAPTLANDPEFREWWANYLRVGASPGAAVALTKMNADIDVRSILPTIQVPTLVIHRKGDRCLLPEEGRYMAAQIPGAEFVELPGDDHLPFVGDSEAVLQEIERFLTGRRQAPEVDRVLATVLYAWTELADTTTAEQPTGPENRTRVQFQTLAARQAELFRGQNFLVDGDAIRLTFDGPARAVHTADASISLADRMELNLCCGVDIGTCDLRPGAVDGPAVDDARWLAENAPFGGVGVSESVLNLVSGSGLEFTKTAVSDSTENTRNIHQLVR